MYSVIVDGQVIDYRYKKLVNNHYAFYIGEVLVGQVTKSGRRGWTAISQYEHHGLCPLSGFKSRADATEFLLKLSPYRNNS